MHLNRRSFLQGSLAAGGLIAATPSMVEALVSGDLIFPPAYAGRSKKKSNENISDIDTRYLINDYWNGLEWKEGADRAFSKSEDIIEYIQNSLGWSKRMSDSFLELGEKFVQASGALLRFMLPPVMLRGLGLGWSILSSAADVTPNLLFKAGQFMVDASSDITEAVKDCILPCVRQGVDTAFEVLGNTFRAVSTVLKFLEGNQGSNEPIRRILLPSEAGKMEGWRPDDSAISVEGVFHPGLEYASQRGGVFVSRESYRVSSSEYMIVGIRYSQTQTETHILRAS